MSEVQDMALELTRAQLTETKAEAKRLTTWVNDCEKRAAEGQARYEEAEARALRWQQRTKEAQAQVKILAEYLRALEAAAGTAQDSIRKKLREAGVSGWTTQT